MSFHEAGLAPSRGGEPGGSGLMVQRKCACGSHTEAGECAECRRRRSVLQRFDRSRPEPVARLTQTGVVEGGSAGLEGEFLGFALRSRATPPALRTPLRLQRQPLSEETPAPPATAAVGTPGAGRGATPGAAPEAVPEAAPEATPELAGDRMPRALIAEDNATELEPGQLRKTEFLDRLQPAVCAEADAALAAAGQSTEGCPYLAGWFGYYRGQSASHVEEALHRYAPETRGAPTAAEYIPLVAARVRQGVERWARTGEMPEGLPLSLPGVAGLAGAAGALASGIGSLLFKAKDGGARAADDPAAVQRELGAGTPLDAGVRSRMERAFGHSFAHVRTHTDPAAARVSAKQNARAFTVGADVAFASGEYRPGTVVGDALIAHELAHTLQQGSETTGASASYQTLERDADEAAVGAVAGLWGGGSGGIAGAARQVTSGLRSGLRLQRCGATRSTTRGQAGATFSCPTATPPEPAAGAATRRGIDPPGQAIIAAAQDTSRPASERAVGAVSSIVCTYFPDEADKVASVRYVAARRGLRIERVGTGPSTRGNIEVGDTFLDGTTESHFARRVLQVSHELQHVDQYRAGMIGENLSDEREFLAHHRSALAREVPGTGRMQRSTRVAVIDGALGYFHCLSPEKQAEYRAQRDELLRRRPIEQRASGHDPTPPPTTCERPE